VNLLFLSAHCCIRVLKQSAVLQAAGHQVTFLQQRVANVEMRPYLSLMSEWDSRECLEEKLTQAAGAFDVVVGHNEPSWLVTAARRCMPNDTIVLDAHDLDLCRYDRMTAEEAEAAMDADGIIVPSDAYALEVRRALKFRGPVAVVRSYLTRDMLTAIDGAQHPAPFVPALVYEGCCNVAHRLSYTDYRGLAAHCRDAGIPLKLRHASCEHDMQPETVCSRCGGPLTLRDVEHRRGPGRLPRVPSSPARSWRRSALTAATHRGSQSTGTASPSQR
jgi:hypothetical protein